MPPVKTEVTRDPPDAGLSSKTPTSPFDAKTQAALTALSNQALAPGIDKQELLSEITSELEDPSRIAQKKANTCGATAAQILLARRAPAEYVRLISGLASPEGKVSMKSGESLARKEDWEAEDGGRTLPSRLLQPAFMEVANGKLFAYDNRHDINLGLGAFPGVMPGGLAHLLQQLDGKERKVLLPLLGKSEEAWSKIQQAVEKKERLEVPVALSYQDKAPIAPAHWMLVTGVKDGFVHLINPRGWEEKMTVEEFRKNLLAAVIEE
ncbi:MAG TPA: hypothetical protein DD435_07305 [Cyanobacteria bacterium UBA8530]|nr:hypothetical protein [Cyanobacteria bacterium UBA8530]